MHCESSSKGHHYTVNSGFTENIVERINRLLKVHLHYKVIDNTPLNFETVVRYLLFLPTSVPFVEKPSYFHECADQDFILHFTSSLSLDIVNYFLQLKTN